MISNEAEREFRAQLDAERPAATAQVDRMLARMRSAKEQARPVVAARESANRPVR